MDDFREFENRGTGNSVLGRQSYGLFFNNFSASLDHNRSFQRRGQDCLNACSLHFAICSNDKSHNDLRYCATEWNITQNSKFDKPERYKSATNFFATDDALSRPRLLVPKPDRFAR